MMGSGREGLGMVSALSAGQTGPAIRVIGLWVALMGWVSFSTKVGTSMRASSGTAKQMGTGHTSTRRVVSILDSGETTCRKVLEKNSGQTDRVTKAVT